MPAGAQREGKSVFPEAPWSCWLRRAISWDPPLCALLRPPAAKSHLQLSSIFGKDLGKKILAIPCLIVKKTVQSQVGEDNGLMNIQESLCEEINRLLERCERAALQWEHMKLYIIHLFSFFLEVHSLF